MNKAIFVIASFAIIATVASLTNALMSMQPAHAVCSPNGSCSNADGSRIGSNGASITACNGGHRTLTSSSGAVLNQGC